MVGRWRKAVHCDTASVVGSEASSTACPASNISVVTGASSAGTESVADSHDDICEPSPPPAPTLPYEDWELGVFRRVMEYCNASQLANPQGLQWYKLCFGSFDAQLIGHRQPVWRLWHEDESFWLAFKRYFDHYGCRVKKSQLPHSSNSWMPAWYEIPLDISKGNATKEKDGSNGNPGSGQFFPAFAWRQEHMVQDASGKIIIVIRWYVICWHILVFPGGAWLVHDSWVRDRFARL